MRRRFLLHALLAAAAIATGGCATTYNGGYAHPVRASVGVSFFYDGLEPYGTWVEVAPYGTVWCPLDVPFGWRPYTVGSWTYTDFGWMWIAEDPWGWVPYHYGRWTFDSYHGWIWIPGDVWAPAWVTWRYGPGWIGWAPLPPEVEWRAGIGLWYSHSDLDRHIHRYHWCFSRAKDFGDTRVRVRVEPSSRNVTLIRKTRNVTKYGFSGSTPVERGLTPGMIEGDVGRTITRYRVTDSGTPLREKGVVVREQGVEVYRPDGRITDVVRERVRQVPPEERPVPSPQLRERVEAERRQIDEHAQREREQLQQEQQREARERPPGVPAEELRRRQEAEQRAQQEVEARERKAVEEREKRLKEREERVRERTEKQREQKAQPPRSPRDRGGR
jgi:hypothetical protein